MNLHVRTAQAQDAAAIDELLVAYAQAINARHPGVGAAHNRLTQPDSTPALVEDGAGAVLGFGHYWPSADAVRCFARVHPQATGLGVGTALLTRLELDAQLRGVERFNAMQPAADALGAGLLAGRGYLAISHVLKMAMSLEGYQAPDTPLPADVQIVGFDHARDAGPLLAAFREAFPAVADSDAEWWRDRVAFPALPFDPTLWSVARHGDQLVGFSLGSRTQEQSGTVGYIGDLGIRPPWRGQGIAHALLIASIAAFAAEGLAKATLNVDAENLTGAIRLYHKAGMHPEPQSTEWQKKLEN